jgi:hypothetical protein
MTTIGFASISWTAIDMAMIDTATTTKDWGADTIVTLVLGIAAVIGFIAALVWTWSRG